MTTIYQSQIVTDPSAPIPAGWTLSDFDPQQHYLKIHKRAVLDLLKPAHEIDFGGLGLEFLHFGNDEEDLDFAVSCLTKAAEAGDLDSIDQLIGVYEDPDCRLHDNKLAARWESKQSTYQFEINVELSNDCHSVNCDEGDGDVGDRLCDAFTDLLDGHVLLYNICEASEYIDNPTKFRDFLVRAEGLIAYLKAGGYIESNYKINFINKRKFVKKSRRMDI